MITGYHVTSSNVDQVGWADNVLYIQFKHGGCYSYAEVPLGAWTALLVAESAGTFINRIIKPSHAATKLERNPFAA